MGKLKQIIGMKWWSRLAHTKVWISHWVYLTASSNMADVQRNFENTFSSARTFSLPRMHYWYSGAMWRETCNNREIFWCHNFVRRSCFRSCGRVRYSWFPDMMNVNGSDIFHFDLGEPLRLVKKFFNNLSKYVIFKKVLD